MTGGKQCKTIGQSIFLLQTCVFIMVGIAALV